MMEVDPEKEVIYGVISGWPPYTDTDGTYIYGNRDMHIFMTERGADKYIAYWKDFWTSRQLRRREYIYKVEFVKDDKRVVKEL